MNPPESFAADGECRLSDFIETTGAPAAYFAIVDGDVVGSVLCYEPPPELPPLLKPEWRKEGYLGHLYVRDGERRTGVGTLLTARALEHLEAQGCTRVRTTTDPDKFSFFRRFGFTERGVELVAALPREPIGASRDG